MAIFPFRNIGEELDPMARPSERSDHSVLDGREIGNEFSIPSVVERPNDFLNEAIADMRGYVGRDREDDGAAAVVKRHRHVPGLGDGGDFTGLRQAPAPG